MLRVLALLLLATPAFAQVAPAPAGPVSRIAFGSCADQNKPCPIWDKLVEAKPELTLMLGDTIYADIEDGKLMKPGVAKIQKCYDELAKLDAWKKLRAASYLLATWDDHDYGLNDAGVEWEHKDEAQRIFHDFFGTPADSPRRKMKGIYHAETFGPQGKRVQVILLDTRYFRTAIVKEAKPLPGTRIVPYKTATEADATMLGTDQWKWLEAELKKPAEVRILCSSIQLVSDDHPFEKWANMPNERAKLYELIKATGANGVIVLSGDRHLGEISLDPKSVGYPLYDATSSGLNQAAKEFRLPEPNKQRVSAMPWGNNYGTILIDWAKPDPLLSVQLRGEDGEVACQVKVPLSTLQAKAGAEAKPAVARPAGVLSPAEAIKKVGEEVTVQFEVAGGRLVGKRILLNSDKDFRSKENFTVVVNDKAWTGKFDKATYDTFAGKTIRATGKVTLFKDAPQIQIDDAARLEIVEAKKE